MFEIRKTKAYARCNWKCNTYKNHPLWDKLKKMDRHIPIGEDAFFIDFGYEYKRTVCMKHAPEAIKQMKDEILKAEQKIKELGWKY